MRKPKTITYQGETMTVKDWSARTYEMPTGYISYETLMSRKRQGWSDKDTIETPSAAWRKADMKAATGGEAYADCTPEQRETLREFENACNNSRWI